MVSVRYLVREVSESIVFYTEALGFKLEQQYGPAMAIVSKGPLSLWLAGPQSSAAQALSSGETPSPGGWNRIVLPVMELPELVANLRKRNVRFRNEIVKGPGGAQILCEDPSGNVVELFEAN